MHPFSDLTYNELRHLACGTFRQGAGSRPDVVRLCRGQHEAVLKDYHGCDGWFGWCLGPLLVRRETRALRRLEGVEGVPRLLGRVDRRALLMQHVPGTPLKSYAQPITPIVFERLEALVDVMHARGVAHCDLRSPNNTLLDAEGRPAIVDFVASVFQGARWNVLWRWVFAQFCDADRAALVKLKRRYAPELLAPGEALERHRMLHRAARHVGAGVRRASRTLLTRR